MIMRMQCSLHEQCIQQTWPMHACIKEITSVAVAAIRTSLHVTMECQLGDCESCRYTQCMYAHVYHHIIGIYACMGSILWSLLNMHAYCDLSSVSLKVTLGACKHIIIAICLSAVQKGNCWWPQRGYIEYIHCQGKTQGLLQPFMVISVAIYMLWSLSVLHFSSGKIDNWVNFSSHCLEN